MRGLAVSVLLVVLAGCEGCGHDDGEGAGGGSTASREPASGGEGRTGESTPPSGSPPSLVVRGERAASGRDVRFVVENHAPAEVSLRSEVAIERRNGETWSVVDEIQSVSLRMDCQTTAPECVALAPGAALHPPPWTGMIGDAQCMCERCVDAPAGDYRIVVTTCDGAHRATSEPVAL